MLEHDCRLFFEVLRWGLKSHSLPGSRPLQRMFSQLGADELALQWNRCRRLQGVEEGILHRASSARQIESKLWLVDVLRAVLPEQPYNICIVGGWVGWLPRLLMWHCPHLVRRMAMIEVDAQALEIAEKLHSDLIQEKKLQLIHADANKYDFKSDFHLIINTSTEHFAHTEWYDRVRKGRLVAMQSTDAHWEPDHVSCVSSLQQLKKRYPVEMTMYDGVLDLETSQRFMTIGRK